MTFIAETSIYGEHGLNFDVSELDDVMQELIKKLDHSDADAAVKQTKLDAVTDEEFQALLYGNVARTSGILAVDSAEGVLA